MPIRHIFNSSFSIFHYHILVPSLRIIYASTSGHTEYVVQRLVEFLREKGKGIVADMQRVESAQPEDLHAGNVLLLASGTWNTGSVEGQLNPYMHFFLKDRAKEADLKGKQVALIALGDDRYRYTANASAHLEEFVATHGGRLLLPTLKVINEPYGQEKKVEEWGAEFIKHLSAPSI